MVRSTTEPPPAVVEVVLPLVGHGHLQTAMLADQIGEWCRELPDDLLPDDPEELTLLALAIAAGVEEGAELRGIDQAALREALAELEAREAGDAAGFASIWPRTVA
jgi:hypothetical protein